MAGETISDYQPPQKETIDAFVRTVRKKAGITGRAKYRVKTDEGLKDLNVGVEPAKLLAPLRRFKPRQLAMALVVDSEPTGENEKGQTLYSSNGLVVGLDSEQEPHIESTHIVFAKDATGAVTTIEGSMPEVYRYMSVEDKIRHFRELSFQGEQSNSPSDKDIREMTAVVNSVSLRNRRRFGRHSG